MNSTVFIVAFLIIWFVPIPFGISIAKKRNRSPHWMWFGLYPVVGAVVAIVLYFSPPKAKCPQCGKINPADAVLCAYCGEQITAKDASANIEKKGNTKRIVLICIVILGAFIFLFAFVQGLFANSDPYRIGFGLIENNEIVKDTLGNSIHKSGIIMGSLSSEGLSEGNADYNFPIEGSLGKGRATIKAVKKDGKWEIIILSVFKNGVELIDSSNSKE